MAQVDIDEFGHNAHSALSTLIKGIFGIAFLFAALGLWLIPAPGWAASMMMMKLAFSLGMAFSGLVFLRSATGG